MSNLVLSLTAWIANKLPMRARRSLYRVEPLAGLIRRGLNMASPSGLTEVTIAAGGLEGLKMSLDLKSEKDYWIGTYEPEMQSSIADLVQPGMVVYDVGANIGYISLLLARKIGEEGKVFAFEALPENVERLNHNISLNGFAERIEVVPKAIVDANRSVHFLVGPSGGMGKVEGSAGRKKVSYVKSIEVDGISLDVFTYNQNKPIPDMVKMDIEGGEVFALSGMKQLLVERHPLILLELHGPEAARIAWDTLKGADYRICLMKPGYPEITSFEKLDWKAYVVACHVEQYAYLVGNRENQILNKE